MLKNYFVQIKIRNFIHSGLYIDHFIKKLISNLLLILFTYAIVFAEKYLIEWVAKCAHKHMYNFKLNKINIDLNFLQIFIFFLNLIMLVVFIC